MVKISIAFNMIKAAVEITDAINALNKETETKAAQVATTEVAAAPTTTLSSTTTTMTHADVPEFEACTCGWTKCHRIDESMEAAATSTTATTPTTPSTPTTPTTMMRANAPVFEACPCDGTECCLNGNTAISVDRVDGIRPLTALAHRVQQEESPLAATTAVNDKKPDTDELETSEDEDQINEIVAELCDNNDTSAAALHEVTDDAAEDAEVAAIIRHELLVSKTSVQRDDTVVVLPYGTPSHRVEAAQMV